MLQPFFDPTLQISTVFAKSPCPFDTGITRLLPGTVDLEFHPLDAIARNESFSSPDVSLMPKMVGVVSEEPATWKLVLCAQYLPVQDLVALERCHGEIRSAILQEGIFPELALASLIFPGTCSDVAASLERRAMRAKVGCLPYLSTITLRHIPTLTDRDIERLLRLCPNLRHLDLANNHNCLSLKVFETLRTIEPAPPLDVLMLPRPKGLTHFRLVSVLRRFSSLRVLDVPLMQPSTSSILVSSNLETLHIGGAVTNDLIELLVGGALPNLKDLALLSCPGNVLVELVQRTPLQYLAMPLEPPCAFSDLSAIIKACGPKLRSLSLMNRLQEEPHLPLDEINDLGMLLAAHCPGLRSLVCHAPHAHLSSGGLACFVKSCTGLQRFHLSHFIGLHDLEVKADLSFEDAPVECLDFSSLVEPTRTAITAFSLRSCPNISRLTKAVWSNSLFDRAAGTLEELNLVRLPCYAPDFAEVETLAAVCRCGPDGAAGLRTLTLGNLPSIPPTLPEILLMASCKGLVECSLCDIPLSQSAWRALSCLRALRDLTLRDVLDGTTETHEVAEDVLMDLPTSCPQLRRFDMYRLGAVVTDDLCLSCMAANIGWRGGPGLRWLRVDFRFGAISQEVANALSSSSRCDCMELRLLPSDHRIPLRRQRSLEMIPRFQALVRAHLARTSLRKMHRAATQVQAVIRGRRIRRMMHLEKMHAAATRLQALARGMRIRGMIHREGVAATRVQAAYRAFKGRLSFKRRFAE